MVKPGFRQTRVMHLEPKRAGTTVGCIVMTLLAVAVIVGALRYPEIWPRPDPPPITKEQLTITEAIAGFVGFLFVLGAISNGRRWRTARKIVKLSNDPAVSTYMPNGQVVAPSVPSPTVPLLSVRFDKPKRFDKHAAKLTAITEVSNVVGYRPMHILYLRLFDNQPRMRTFIEGAWREFGFVYMLRTATSVTPDELRSAKRSKSWASLFVDSDEKLWSFCDSCGYRPLRKGRYTFKSIAPTTIHVRDKFGSYPARPMLCHGSYWQSAVTHLLAKMDLVAMDLSGFTESHAGMLFELQHVVNSFPIERVVFLIDANTNKKFIEAQLQSMWAKMPEGSPNTTPGTRVAVVAVTDVFQQTTSQQGQSSQVYVRLVARRPQTRRVVFEAQRRVHPSPSPVGWADNQTRG
jgi:hypothetical protein